MSIVGVIAGEAVALTVEEAGEFLQKHPDVIRDVINAFSTGATKEDVKRGIRSTMIVTAEEALESEIGPRPK